MLGCNHQKLEPTAPVYNITTTQTDNSQVLIGDNNKVKAKPLTELKTKTDIKPEVTAEAELTTKNGMWIYWLIITILLVLTIWFLWNKKGSFKLM